jgi:hypothetical protein
MPSPQQILDGLTSVANEWRAIAIAWHVLLGALLIAMLRGWYPSRRLLGVLLATPLLSVSVLAWTTGNPFNGIVFAAVALVLAITALRLPRASVRIAAPWLVGFGGFLFAFGWVYPHFLRTESWVAYLYAAPLGLIPCPSLSAIVGIALIAGGLGSRSWSLLLAAAGMLYAVIGVVRLGVVIDLALFAGALALGVVAVVNPEEKDPSTSAPNARTTRHVPALN